MKKILLLLLAVVLLTACSANNGKSANDNKPDKDNKPAAGKLSDYFPITENTKYEYEGTGNEFASYVAYTEYTSNDKIQQRLENGGTVTARVCEIKDEKLTRLLSRGETYYRENLMDQKDETKEILLMEPLKKGTKWTLNDGRERQITSINSKIETPSGNYKAIEVVTKGTEDQTTDYYAKGVGLVMSVYRSGEFEVTSSLASVTKDTGRTETIRFFYPNLNADKIEYVEKDVTFRTNDNTAKILEEAYKAAVSDKTGKVLSANTKVNSLKIDENRIVKVDLNKAFITEMNAGAAYETMILQSIANTLGRYYSADQVLLTVEGKPYESGHIRMQEGETLRVKYD